MGEMLVGWTASLKLLLVVAFATFYWIGGRTGPGKVWRRYVGGLLFPLAVIGISLIANTFHWLFLLSILAYPVALSMGYGGEGVWEKIRLRSIYGLLLGSCGLFFAIPMHAWVLGFYQIVLAIMSSVILGTVNPTDAAEEEALIATMSVIMVPFMV